MKYLYRKNSNGKVSSWIAFPTGEHTLCVRHGVIDGEEISQTITTHRTAGDEVKSRINEKRKQGYKYVDEIKDDNVVIEPGTLTSFLNTYLPVNRTSADGGLLPMLAKTYDANSTAFNKIPAYLGQWKINGLRCFISAERDKNSLFGGYSFKFRSREGTYWNSLKHLEAALLEYIDESFLERMIDNNWILDGEVYLPGYTINDINHFVKNPNAPQNKMLQFWCYDIAMESTPQAARIELLFRNFGARILYSIHNIDMHHNITDRFNILPMVHIDTPSKAIWHRDKNIELGFEGLILRNPNAEYQFGKRNSSMLKFKKHTDGLFTIVDIKPEGVKRPDIPLFVCKNDINSSLFEVHLSETLDFQRNCLKLREHLIGVQLKIEYGERSGINQVPFHVKHVSINPDVEKL